MVFGVGTVRCSFLRVMGTIYVFIISSKNPRKTKLEYTRKKNCFVIFYSVIREKKIHTALFQLTLLVFLAKRMNLAMTTEMCIPIVQGLNFFFYSP
jgi:hypothetical protein